MNYIRIIAVALLLTGCTAIQARDQAKEFVDEDINEAREWRGHHKALVAVVEQSYLDRAQELMLKDDWDAAEAAFEALLQFSIDNQPKLLIERLKARIDRAKLDKQL